MSKLFKTNKAPNTTQYHHAETVRINGLSLTNNTIPYDNATLRTGIDSIAKHIAKAEPRCIVNNTIAEDSTLQPLLVRPNEFMSIYDFLYKVTTHYFLYNNAYIMIDRDNNGNIIAFYPITANAVEYGTDNAGTVYCRFIFADGKDLYVKYSNLIHLRRYFNNDELIGDSNKALNGLLSVSETQNEGMITSIERGVNIRGLLSFANKINEELLEEKRKHFLNTFLSIQNDGGVIVTDAGMNYTPLDSKPISIDTAELRAIEERIYNYLGVNKNIVNSTYTEDEFLSFYENTLEPLLLQFSLEFTEKCFTALEKRYGHKINFESKRMQFSSNSSKIKLVQTLLPTGLLTQNQALEILNLPKIEGEEGNKRLQTLNYIDTKIANEYQLDLKGSKEESEEA